MVGQEGAARAPLLPPRAEHEVVRDQLATAVEEVGQRRLALRPLEHVGLVHPHPRHRAPLGAQLVAQPREFLFPCQMRPARLEPFLSRHDRVVWHHPSFCESSCLVWVVGAVSPVAPPSPSTSIGRGPDRQPDVSLSRRSPGRPGSSRCTGSSSRSRHSSTRIIVAAAVIGLVNEAMRKIVSRRIGSPPPTAFVPIASTCTSPRRLTSVTIPGTSPRST